MSETEGHDPRPAGGWAVVTIIGLFSGVTVEAGVLALEAFATHVVPDWELLADNGDGVGIGMMLAFAWGSILGIGASVLTALAFLTWLFRAVRFARSRGIRPNSTPVGAVACWFIPFVNLVRPYDVVRTLYRVSTAAGGRGYFRFGGLRGS